MPADVHTLRIKDVTLGDRVTFQILALTDHPVGRTQDNRSSATEADSGIESAGVDNKHGKLPISAKCNFCSIFSITQQPMVPCFCCFCSSVSVSYSVFSRALLLARSDSTSHSAMLSVQLSVYSRTLLILN